jgi:hypothetical protein
MKTSASTEFDKTKVKYSIRCITSSLSSTHFILSSLILNDLLLAESYYPILIKGCALSGYLYYLHIVDFAHGGILEVATN